MAQQFAASRTNGSLAQAGQGGRTAPRLDGLQTLIDTGAARAFDSLSDLLERRPIKIPQLVDTIDNALTLLDVSILS